MTTSPQNIAPASENVAGRHMEDARAFCDTATHYLGWQIDLLRPYVGKRVLEIGAGVGRMTMAFVGDADAYYITEIVTNRVNALQEMFKEHHHLHVLQADLTDTSSLSRLADASIDTIICCNVLEHMADDRAALRNMFAILRSGGHVLLQVPALPCLYSDWDRAIGHHRRYVKRGLRGLAEDSGFTTAACQYFNLVGTLGWLYFFKWRRKIVSEARDTHGMVQSAGIYDRYLVPMARRLESIIAPPAGLAIFYVGLKPAEPSGTHD